MTLSIATLHTVVSQRKRRDAQTRRAFRQARRARFESLENRELLAVSLAEYSALRDAYSALDLPADVAQVNVLEIPANEISVASLKAAFEEAASTRSDDLIVLRTTNGSNVAQFADASDELKYELDSNFFGKTTVVALGDVPLVIDAKGFGRCLSVAVGELALANVVLQNGKVGGQGGCALNAGGLTLDGCALDAGNAASGGAIYSSGGLTARNTTFDAAQGDEGVYVGGEARFENCEIVQNSGAGLTVGSGGAATIIGGELSDNGESGVRVYLGELTAEGARIAGNGGGGIANSGATILADCQVVDNSGSGLLNACVTAGASYAATLTADRVLISGNAADAGAGVRNVGGQIELSNCEISNNQAATVGGGLANETASDFVDRVALTNCTIAGNCAGEAGGGVYGESNFGLSIYNSIVAQNLTFGVDSNLSGEATIKNSVLGGNPEFVVPPIFDYASGKLANGETLDLRLTSGSVAVNAGDSARVPDGALDLKGEKRLYGRVDAGAYEYRNTGEPTPTRSLVVTTLADVFDPNDGETSLREALAWATAKNNAITFADGLAGTIKLGSQLVSTTSLQIDGDGRIAISAQDGSRVMLNEAGLVLNGVTLSEGKTSGDGGLVRSVGSLEIVGSRLEGGVADGRGGQIFSTAPLKISNSTLVSGGGSSAVYSNGDATITETEIADAAGDGFYEYAGFATFVDSTAKGCGGSGIVDFLGVVELTNVVLSSNQGAGLANMGTATLLRATIEGNGASGVLNESVPLADGSYFTASTAASLSNFIGNVGENGGAINNKYGRFTASNCVFVGNTATFDGGALYNETRAGTQNTASLTNCTVAGNVAGRSGGGVASTSADSLLFLLNSIVSQNYAGDVDSNLSGVAASSDGSLVGGAPEFATPPLFDYAAGRLANFSEIDLRLAETSSAIDLGDEVYNVATTDFVGSPRVSGASVDAGAYEFVGTKVDPATPRLVVTTLDDSFDPNDGKTSLREALFFANTPGVVISFADGLSGTIRLASQLVAPIETVVDGAGRIKIDAGTNSRAFLVEAPTSLVGLELVDGASASDGGLIYASARLNLTSVSLVGAKCAADGLGGAIYAKDALSLADVRVEGAESDAAIRALADLDVVDSVIRDSADGICCEGTTRLDRVLVVDNSGVGVRNLYGTITATNSAFSRNGETGLDNLGEASLTSCSVSNNGLSGIIVRSDAFGYSSRLKFERGAIKGNATLGFGGGILNEGGALELENVEISGNVAANAGGGVYNERRANSRNAATLTNCTIAGNSAATAGGVGASSAEFATNLYNTIIARNYATSGAANLQGAATESVRSLASGAPGFRVDPLFDADGALLNPSEYDLRLTRTSVCVDAGDSSRAPGEFDATGSPRLVSVAVDIGAYEYCQEASTVVTTLEDVFDLLDDAVSLREALYFAADGDVVTFGALEGVAKVASPLSTSRNVAIDGLGLIVLDGAAGSGGLINNSGTLRLVGLTFANGSTEDEGGAIRNVGALTLDACVFDACDARLGGAIFNDSGATLVGSNVVFTSNKADYAGGALYNAGTATFVNASFRKNTTAGTGGAIYSAGDTRIVDSLLAENKATLQGGAVYLSEGAFVSTNVTIARNEAASGGGFYGLAGDARFENAIVATNVGTDVAKTDAQISATRTISSQQFASTGVTLYDGSSALFTDPILGDYRPAQGSLAIDAGSTELAIQSGLSSFATDLNGTRRYLGDSVDVGAFENVPRRSERLTVSPGEAFELSTGAEGAKTLWDLSGDGTGDYVETSKTRYTAGELGFAPGTYSLRGKTENAAGETIAEKGVLVQIVDAFPSVQVAKAPVATKNAVVYSIEIKELGVAGLRSWRVDWGDGSSSFFTGTAFNAGKIYAPSTRAKSYDVDLVLIDENGLDAGRFRIDGVVIAPAATGDLGFASAVEDAAPSVETFAEPELADALLNEAFVDYEDAEPLEQIDDAAFYVAENQERFLFDVVGVEQKALKRRKKGL